MEMIVSKLAAIGPFFLLLGVLIFIHEWGHFIVARLCGVRVETFSIGFGPKIFSKTWGDTNYCLSLIPLGGYVKMFGDGTEDKISEDQKGYSFNDQHLLEKIAIVSAGPLLNLIFAFFLFVLLGGLGVPKIVPILGEMDTKTAAYQAGMRYGDKIIAVNNTDVRFYEDVRTSLEKVDQNQAQVTLLRGDKKVQVNALVSEVKNSNPLLDKKTSKEIDGLSLLRTSNQVGISFDSPLKNKGLSSLETFTSVNGTPSPDFYSLKNLVSSVPKDQNLVLSFQRNKGESIDVSIDANGEPWSLKKIGIVSPELIIGKVQRGSPASQAGLKTQDQILFINGLKMSKWEDVVSKIKSTPEGEASQLTVGRGTELVNLEIKPKRTELITPTGQVEYRQTIGIMPALEYLPPKTVFQSVDGVFGLVGYGLHETFRWSKVTLKGFKKLLFGEVSHKTLSGVISIGKVAKDSLSIGWIYFLQMMAIISINLFLLNLLPVPVLDGGHLLFYTVELVSGRPVSLKTKIIGQQIGLVLILSLVAYTIFNDLTRIVFSGW